MALKEEAKEPSQLPRPPKGTESDEGVVLRRRRADWSGGVREAYGDAFAARRAAINVAAATLAAYDGVTAGHSDDVETLCTAIADQLDVPEPRRTYLLAAAQLHDIGKVGVPPAILDKPGPLDGAEWEVMRRHTVSGERILASVPELDEVGRIVRHSHERFDGHGYPDGLAGEDIPLESRIVFCADAFHAIRCDRPYRAGRSADQALEEVRANAGAQFDPEVVEALARTVDNLRRSAADRVAALTDGVRSRRLVALLLTLVVGGSALAAPGSPLRGLLFGEGDGSAQASTCREDCAPAQLGSLGHLRGQAKGNLGGGALAGDGVRGDKGRATAGGRSGGRVDAGRAGQGAGRTSGGRDGIRGGRGGRGATPWAPAGQGAPSRSPSAQRIPAPVRAPQPSRSLARRWSDGAPGRSGEAPRRPASPGKPTGPAPGRSGEAPGKPAGPGKFGHR